MVIHQTLRQASQMATTGYLLLLTSPNALFILYPTVYLASSLHTDQSKLLIFPTPTVVLPVSGNGNLQLFI